MLITIGLLLLSCERQFWDDHYGSTNESSNDSLLNVIRSEPRYSTFLSKLEENKLDTLFGLDEIYTLFIPTNQAFENAPDSIEITGELLSYLITSNIILTQSIGDDRKLQMLSKKYAVLEDIDGQYYFDGISIDYSSPLYADGKIYEISELATPLLNIYEYIASYSSTLKKYIDSTDSIYFDIDLSTPIGFDADGNTVYDSVFSVLNLFEANYFEISQEFRENTGTFLLFTQEQYEEALNEMASKLGGEMNSFEDIPEEWQNEIFFPLYIRKSMFAGSLVYDDLTQGRLQSITGDSVDVDYLDIDPLSRNVCSNGITFLNTNLSVPDSLFIGESVIEGEDLLESIGSNTWSWDADKVSYTLSSSAVPSVSTSSDASGGELLVINFGQNFSGTFKLEFSFKNIFPMQYRFEWRGTSRPSGNYAVYANDELLEYGDKWGNVYTEFDSYKLRSDVYSVTNEYFRVDNGYNTRDYYINNQDEFGEITIRFEYLDSGSSSTNGFNLDYVKLIPVI